MWLGAWSRISVGPIALLTGLAGENQVVKCSAHEVVIDSSVRWRISDMDDAACLIEPTLASIYMSWTWEDVSSSPVRLQCPLQATKHILRRVSTSSSSKAIDE